jgi:hypothetical protein
MLKRFAVAALLAVGLSTSASATTVTYLFSGIVDVSGDASVPLGSSFAATFVIDLATPASSTGAGFTSYDGAVVSASFSIGSGSGATGLNVSVGDGYALGDFFTIANGGSFTGTFGANVLIDARIELIDTAGAVIASQALQIPSDPTQFDLSSNQFSMRFSGPSDPVFRGHITSIQLVPEPTLPALLGTGVLAIALRRRSSAT